ncbi:beta-ketoacyl-[acyl-carrier-protein] synthase family protein [Neptunomonas antarctica]|uniref:3-oxoacyl-[acyl-carrier-protein] synthase-1 n=1 Tax=Neptunomonas antarctica TaxID=619304 RepID=A0A1N7ISY4_9GAMM|nr:beta-ketoacyl-[acyl-carrier-protein] synthase family protein [Neptunomonas antarctica]SIS40208.1 3-oxoacyl-[acyl-carrier-protein] synthase-1 [Neptunomonas antarctica]
MTSSTCYLNALGMLCAAGDCATSIAKNLSTQQNFMTITDAYSNGTALPLGLYHGELPQITLPDNKWQSRNNQFALAALNQIKPEVTQAIAQYGADRVGVIIGTSTSGIAESETAIRQWAQTGNVPAYYDYGLQEMGATAQFIGTLLGVRGPTYSISTACSSGAKALASARRLIRAGICDAVIAGGVDTLCKLTVQGFSSLEAVSETRCNPFSKHREGINIGEGAALFLVTNKPTGAELSGVGEGSDAHHISAPDPTGAGAIRCMSAALQDAGIDADAVGYVNLHGTATVLNDTMESIAMHQVFGSDTPCSSTKPFTGHTLGAAGAIEAGICWLLLQEALPLSIAKMTSNMTTPTLPVHVWDQEQDETLPTLNLVTPDFVTKSTTRAAPLHYALSNSFAFGGNNISLILGRIK